MARQTFVFRFANSGDGLAEAINELVDGCFPERKVRVIGYGVVPAPNTTRADVYHALVEVVPAVEVRK